MIANRNLWDFSILQNKKNVSPSLGAAVGWASTLSSLISSWSSWISSWSYLSSPPPSSPPSTPGKWQPVHKREPVLHSLRAGRRGLESEDIRYSPCNHHHQDHQRHHLHYHHQGHHHQYITRRRYSGKWRGLWWGRRRPSSLLFPIKVRLLCPYQPKFNN